MKYKILLDAGHWGQCFGHYDMYPGKRSPEVPPGIYEGVFNREVCYWIDRYLENTNICCKIINPGPMRISSRTKVDFVNRIARLEDVLFIEIHANASPKKGWSNANGFRVFCATNASLTSKILMKNIKRTMENALDRKIDKRLGGIGTKKLITLTKTTCPAVLVECGFMTNKTDAEWLNSYPVKRDIALAIVDAIKQTMEEK